METEADLRQLVERPSKVRWLGLFAVLFVVEALILNVTADRRLDAVNFILGALGGATGQLLIAFLLSLLAKREKRFYACCWIAFAITFLVNFGRFND